MHDALKGDGSSSRQKQIIKILFILSCLGVLSAAALAEVFIPGGGFFEDGSKTLPQKRESAIYRLFTAYLCDPVLIEPEAEIRHHHQRLDPERFDQQPPGERTP